MEIVPGPSSVGVCSLMGRQMILSSCNMFCWDTEDTEEAGSDFAEKLTFAAYFELRISDPG